MNIILKCIKDIKYNSWLSFFFGIVICGCLLYINLYKINYIVNSDFAAQIILADIINETNTLVPVEWNFSTELHISFATLFASFFLKFTASWKMAYILSNLLTYIIVVCLSIQICKLLEICKWKSFLNAVILIAPMSESLIYYYSIGNEYMTYFVYELIFLFFWLNILKRTKKSFSKVFIVLWWIWCFFLGSMGTRYALACFVPAIISEFIVNYYYADPSGWQSRSQLYYKSDKCFHNMFKTFKEYIRHFINNWIGYFLAIGGYVFNRLILSSMYRFQAHNSRYFMSVENFFERLARSLHMILELFGYESKAKLFSLQGIICIFALVWGGGALIWMIKICIKSLRNGAVNYGNIIFYIFTLVAIIMSFCVMIFTQESEDYYSDIRGKYFILSMYLIVPIFLKECTVFKQVNVIRLFCIYVTVASLCACTKYEQGNSYKDRIDAINYLVEKNVNYGYGSFWNANYTTYLSNGKIIMNPVTSFSDLTFQRWLSSERLYELTNQSKFYFVWLANDEKIDFEEAIANYSNNSFKIYILKGDVDS